MSSVTNRIKQIKQPRGGFISPNLFSQTALGPGEEELAPTSFYAGTIATAVDYLTRFMLGTPREDAFEISMLGAAALHGSSGAARFMDNAMDKADALLSGILGLDDASIVNSCKLCGFDVCYRAGTAFYKPIELMEPDDAAIGNIRLMVNRSLVFFDRYGPITLDGPTFPGGYTPTVHTGDADFLTESTIWDMKVSPKPPTSKHTLQILMYYLMGKHSTIEEFRTVHNLGLFNPRLNIVYLLDANTIDPAVIRTVENEVICY